MITVTNEFRVLKHVFERFRQARIHQIAQTLCCTGVRHESMNDTQHAPQRRCGKALDRFCLSICAHPVEILQLAFRERVGRLG